MGDAAYDELYYNSAEDRGNMSKSVQRIVFSDIRSPRPGGRACTMQERLGVFTSLTSNEYAIKRGLSLSNVTHNLNWWTPHERVAGLIRLADPWGPRDVSMQPTGAACWRLC